MVESVLRTGEEIGRYRIGELLGAGGMGAVYEAEHTLLGSAAAIKVLLPELSKNQQIVNRFFNEAKAAAAIRHPGIVEIYDFGYHSDGSAYIVMERLDGESLEERLRRLKNLPANQAISFCRQAASALGSAHKKGIVHRDLKPGNIFLVADPDVVGGERAKLLDFGIAKLSQEAATGLVKTRTGAVMGTPLYMSPEQCRGADDLDHRSDLYSLGCILFEMLCGRPPFLGEGGGDVLGQHIYVEPPMPRALDPRMTPELEDLILRLLAKDPAARPANAEALIQALDSVSGHARSVPQVVMPDAHTALGRPHVGGLQTTLSAAASATNPRPTQRTRLSSFAVPIAVAGVAAVIALVVMTGVGGGAGDTSPPGDEPGPPPAAASGSMSSEGDQPAERRAGSAPAPRVSRPAAASPDAGSPDLAEGSASPAATATTSTETALRAEPPKPSGKSSKRKTSRRRSGRRKGSKPGGKSPRPPTPRSPDGGLYDTRY